MKRWISLIFAGTFTLILAGWALSQVPAALVRSGIVIGQTTAQSSGVHGTAVFSATGATITGLHVTGCVTGVTYGTQTGQYLIALSACPTNYVVQFSAGDGAQEVVGNLNLPSTYLATGFTAQYFSLGGVPALYDPALVFITIP